MPTESDSLPTPCDDLREPFSRPGRCVNCGVLATLHHEHGWRRYYKQRAERCESLAKARQADVNRLVQAAADARDHAERFPL